MSMREATKQTFARLGILQPVRSAFSFARIVFSFARSHAHRVREIAYRMPLPLDGRSGGAVDLSDRARQYGRTLAEKGIVVLPEFLQGQRLAAAQAAMEEMVSRIQSNGNGPEKINPPGYLPQVSYLEDEANPEARTVCSNNPFKHSATFLSMSLDPLILGIVAAFLRRPFFLQQSVASRYLPMPPQDFGSFQWHHDAWGRKVNAMFLLTDVSESDQYMTFIEGSHHYVHRLERCLQSRYHDSEVASLFPLHTHLRCTGKAGTVFVFDANGMHRGNRSTGRHRDTLITNYNAGRYVWDFDVPEAYRSDLSQAQLAFLHKSSKVHWTDGS